MPDKDKYTALVALHQTEGYFIRVKAGRKVEKPIQACLFVSESNVSQNVHNIIIVEDGAEANVITGCNIHADVKEGLHAGISEFYVGKGAKLTFTMVHNWAEDFSVRPRTGVIVDDDGDYINNYVLLKPVKSIQAFPVAKLDGRRAHARSSTRSSTASRTPSSTWAARRSSSARASRSEAVARTVSLDRSAVYSRGRLIGADERLQGAPRLPRHRAVARSPRSGRSRTSRARARPAPSSRTRPRSPPSPPRRSTTS